MSFASGISFSSRGLAFSMTRCETPVVGPWPGRSSLAPQRLMYSAISGCSKFAAKVCEVLGSLSSSSATHVEGRGDRVHRHRPVRRLEDEPVSVFGERSDQLAAG